MKDLADRLLSTISDLEFVQSDVRRLERIEQAAWAVVKCEDDLEDAIAALRKTLEGAA